jgi:N-formylglutamate amidohydrolase
MLEQPFEIHEPDGDESPVVVEVPHAGLAADAEALAWMAAPAYCMARDSDLYVHELFADAPKHGASMLVARVSRYIVDLNRAAHDYDDGAVEGGGRAERPRGVIWRLSSDGMPVLRRRLSRDEYLRRIEHFYRPYHDALEALLQRKRERFGFVVMLCAHSMPTPRSRGAITADMIPGTRGRTSAGARWIDLIDSTAREHGFRVQHDVPYRGGYSTGHYGQPDEHQHVVQLEIARRLYMSERNLAREPKGFAAMRAFSGELVARLVDEARAVYGEASALGAADGD